MNNIVIIELLDGDLRIPIQTWTVNAGTTCQLGRAADSDIVIRNPYVSRCHAYLLKSADGWQINSVSDRGVLIDGKPETSAPLVDGTEFRLARRGPLMRFRIESTQSPESIGVMETIGTDDARFPILMVDQQKRDQDVAGIEKQEYFSQLQQIAQQLRGKRRPPS